jgi:hypothetical protein
MQSSVGASAQPEGGRRDKPANDELKTAKNELRRAKEELQNLNAMLASLFQFAPDAIVTVDAAGRNHARQR